MSHKCTPRNFFKNVGTPLESKLPSVLYVQQQQFALHTVHCYLQSPNYRLPFTQLRPGGRSKDLRGVRSTSWSKICKEEGFCFYQGTVLNMTLKVTSYFKVFSVKNLILQKIHIIVFINFLMRAQPFLLVVMSKTKPKKYQTFLLRYHLCLY